MGSNVPAYKTGLLLQRQRPPPREFRLRKERWLLLRLPVTGREVLVFQLVSRLELEFPFAGDVVFEDLETGRRVGGNATRMRDASLRALGDRRAWVRRTLLEQGAVHELLAADEPLDCALRDFLRRRQRFA